MALTGKSWAQVVATTSCQDVLRQMGMLQGFTKVSHVNLIEAADQLLPLIKPAFDEAVLATIIAAIDRRTLNHPLGAVPLRIGVKKVFDIIEMARQADEAAETFLDGLYAECRSNAL